MCLATIPAGQQWIVVLVSVVFLVEAYIDLTQLKVPNRITLPTILTGWLYATVMGAVNGADITVYLPVVNVDLFNLSGAVGGAVEGLWSSLGLTFYWPTWVLFGMWAIHGMGAGDVKMHMGFGAWMAAIYGWDLGSVIVTWGFIVGVVVGGGISVVLMWMRGDFAQNRKNMAAIVGDLFSSKSVDEVADKAKARRPLMQIIPYGVPLCIGYLAYVIVDHFGLLP
jgi:prepilin peptidase CpaA